MQSKNGGWGAFDIDNNFDYLNNIPFADHGALLDPPTADVSARCLSFLKQQNDSRSIDSIKKGLRYLISEQEENGSWFGRWGTNYIYGTWSVLSALNLLDFPEKKEVTMKAVNYLKSMQRKDGGWGEDGVTYFKNSKNINLKVVLVTGAGGSIGSEICRQITKLKPKKLLLIEQNEFGFGRKNPP